MSLQRQYSEALGLQCRKNNPHATACVAWGFYISRTGIYPPKLSKRILDACCIGLLLTHATRRSNFAKMVAGKNERKKNSNMFGFPSI